MNTWNLGFPACTFDIVLSGFMGWYDCFDFKNFQFTREDIKTREIRRVLREGGKLVCCSWEEQEDLAWMENAILQHYPTIIEDEEYLKQRPIGMAYEKASGYEIILQNADFRNIEISRETMTFVSNDEEEWWRQMENVGWASLINKIGRERGNELTKVKEAIFTDLQTYKHFDGIRFKKGVFFVSGVK